MAQKFFSLNRFSCTFLRAKPPCRDKPLQKKPFLTGLTRNDHSGTSSMSSSDEQTQQRFVFGNGGATLPGRNIPPGCCGPRDEPTSTEMLSLRRSELTRLPEVVLRSGLLTYLCLEGNQISSIPVSMFCVLPHLKWLNLGMNLITSLPVEIGSHRSLRNLILEANPISELPAELGSVITLTGLCLRDCPIQFPPKEVLHQGCSYIMQYLRTILAQRKVTERKSLPADEQLQLLELTDSSVEEPDDDGLQRFRELRDELISLERAEAAWMARSSRRPRLVSVAKRKGSCKKVGAVPELHVVGNTFCGSEERRAEAAARELRAKRALMEKERKEALQKCNKQAKRRGQTKRQEADSTCQLEGSRRLSQDQTGFSAKRDEYSFRSARELGRNIFTHVKRMQERHLNPSGATYRQTDVTEEDVVEMRKLQARLCERKTLGRYSEKPFTIYTADSWPSILFK